MVFSIKDLVIFTGLTFIVASVFITLFIYTTILITPVEEVEEITKTLNYMVAIAAYYVILFAFLLTGYKYVKEKIRKVNK